MINELCVHRLECFVFIQSHIFVHLAEIIGIAFDPTVYNVSEGEVAVVRVVLNTTVSTDRTITVNVSTQDGTAIGKW